MPDLKNLEHLPQEIRSTVERYVQELIRVYPGEIDAVAVYGSAAGKTYVPRHSNINMVVVLKELSLENLQRGLRLFAQGKRQSIPAPLLLTKRSIAASTDVFPIEFLDIKENHVLLFGEDIFSSLPISHEHLRLFCEHEIKGKLVRIRQAYADNGLKAGAVEELLKESLHALIPVFRNLIRLKGEEIKADKMETLRALASLYHLEGKVFYDILHHRMHHESIPIDQLSVWMGHYLNQLEILAQGIDQG